MREYDWLAKVSSNGMNRHELSRRLAGERARPWLEMSGKKEGCSMEKSSLSEDEVIEQLRERARGKELPAACSIQEVERRKRC